MSPRLEKPWRVSLLCKRWRWILSQWKTILIGLLALLISFLFKSSIEKSLSKRQKVEFLIIKNFLTDWLSSRSKMMRFLWFWKKKKREEFFDFEKKISIQGHDFFLISKFLGFLSKSKKFLVCFFLCIPESKTCDKNSQ